jgi:hypothetical protein
MVGISTNNIYPQRKELLVKTTTMKKWRVAPSRFGLDAGLQILRRSGITNRNCQGR